MREQLVGRDALLRKAVQYSEQQEEVIMELRGYIEQYNIDLVRRMEKLNEGKGLPTYQKSTSKTGKPKLDRMMAVEQLHMFELYKSVVLIDKTAEKGVVKTLEDEIVLLKE